MKIITERQEVAKALNFCKYPVLSLDLAKDKLKGYDGCYSGEKVRFKYGTNLWHGNLRYFYDSGLSISSDSAMITASFGYRDVMEDVEIAHAPIVEKDQDVVVVIHDSEKRIASVVITHIKDINPNCSTAIEFEVGFKEIVKNIEEWVGSKR